MRIRPPTRFATTSDGARIAYCTHGDGPPLLFVRGWISHLEAHWLVPSFRRYIEALAREFTVIRYDTRGQGLSDWDDVSLDADSLLLDIDAIYRELGLDDAVLYGQCYGGPISVMYAHANPDRVTRLVLDGSYARGADIMSGSRRESFLQTLESLWPDSRALLAHLTNPDRDLKQDQPLPGELVQSSTPPHVARRLYEIAFTFDVSDFLASLRVPTLVMHRRRSKAVSFVLGRTLAGGIPGASFVALEGSAHNPWEGDPQAPIDALAQFLGRDIWLPARPPSEAFRGPVAILFTDMEASTEMTSQLGDAKAQRLVHLHDEVVRSSLADHDGREVRHTGDGIMAYFTSVSASLSCATDVQRTLEKRSATFRIRIGVHVGEPLWEGDDPHGTVVQTARRVAEEAQAGQILVSDVVRTLVAGKEFPFREVGSSELKGLREPVRLFELDWMRAATAGDD